MLKLIKEYYPTFGKVIGVITLIISLLISLFGMLGAFIDGRYITALILLVVFIILSSIAITIVIVEDNT